MEKTITFIFMLNYVSMIKGKLKIECIDNYNIRRSFNSTWYSQGCKCKCESKSNESKVVCMNCLKPKQAILLQVFPINTDVYFLDSKLDITCEPYYPINNYSLTLSPNESCIVNSGRKAIGGNCLKQNKTMCAKCSNDYQTSAEKCYTLIERKPNLGFSFPGNLYPTHRLIKILCQVNPFQFMNFFRNLSMTDENKTTISGIIDVNSNKIICMKCVQYIKHDFQRIFKDVTKCLRPASKITFYPNCTTIYYFDHETQVSCIPNNPLYYIYDLNSEVFYENYRTVLIGGKYNKSNGTLCISCRSSIDVDKRSCFTMLDKKPQLRLNYTGNLYPLNRSLIVICVVIPDNVARYFNRIRLLMNSRAFSGRFDGVDYGVACLMCVHDCGTSYSDNLNSFSKCLQPERNFLIKPIAVTAYFYDFTSWIYCYPVAYFVFIEWVSNEIFIDNTTFLTIGGKYNKSNRTICATCLSKYIKYAENCYSMLDSIPKFTLNILGNFYPLQSSIVIKCYLRPNKTRKHFNNITMTTEPFLNQMGLLNGSDVGPVCFKCFHFCQFCKNKTILKKFKKCLKAERSFNLEPRLLDVYGYSDHFEIFCVPSDLEILLTVDTDEAYYVSNSKVHIGGKYNKSNKTICAYCNSEITQLEDRCFKFIGAVPAYTLSIHGNMYPVGRNITIRCVLKPNITQLYFQNYTIKTNPNVTETGFLDGKNVGKFSFHCIHRCNPCIPILTIPEFKKYLEPQIMFHVEPMVLTAYFFDFTSYIHCEPILYVSYLYYNTTEVWIQSQNFVLIGGIYNHSNKTICASCFTGLYESTYECYAMIDLVPKFTLNHTGNLYILGESKIIGCRILPNSSGKYFRNITLYTIPNIGKTGYMNGSNMSTICFHCNHYCKFCKDPVILSNYKKCLKPHPFYSLSTLGFNIYLYSYVTEVFCEPIDIYVSLEVDTDELYVVSNSRVIIGGKYNKSNGTICAFCHTALIQYKEECFKLYDLKLMIKPSNMDIYFANTSMIVSCVLVPKGIINENHNYFKMFTMTVNNTRIRMVRHMVYIITGDNFGTVCFVCGSSFIANIYKCYRYFDLPLTIKIEPSDIKIYLHDVPMTVICVVKPDIIITSNLIGGIDFLYHNSTNSIVTVRQIKFASKGTNPICFVCGVDEFINTTMCYKYHVNNVVLSIQPNYTKIYIVNIQMKITCEVTPPEIILANLIEGIKFTFNNSTYSSFLLREVTIDGANHGFICFVCGHPILNYTTRCYNFYDKPIHLEIYPNDTEIYLPKIKVNITCSSVPENIINNDLLSNISFIFNSSPFPKLSERLIQIDGTNAGNICVVCGHPLLKNKTKCYKYYDSIVNLTIEPSDISVYFRDSVLDIKCVVTPMEVITRSLILGIKFTFSNGTVTHISNRHVQAQNNTNVKICFVCGHPMLTSANKCYSFYNKSVHINIDPSDTKIYFFYRSMTVFCIVKPDQIITEHLIPNIRFTYFNGTTSSVSHRVVLIQKYNVGTLCFKCGHRVLGYITRCYRNYDKHVNLEILPNDTKIYIPYESISITCEVYPDEIIVQSLITNIRFTTQNSTMIPVSLRHIIYDGFKRGTICFECGHIFTGFISRCYELYDTKITINIIPNDTLVYFSNNNLSIYCEIHPEEILNRHLIFNISFNSSALNAIKITPTQIFIAKRTIPGLTICVVCGHRILHYVSRCYEQFDYYNLTITPNNIDIYLVKFTTDVRCKIFPNNLSNFVSNIDFVHVNTQYLQVGVRHVRFGPFQSNYKDVCLTCGHLSMINVTKCYKPFSGSVSVNITPVGDTIFYLYKNFINCTYSPFYIDARDVQFVLYGLSVVYYLNNSYLSKSILKTVPRYFMKICLVCGNTVLMNVSKCYNLTNQTVDIIVSPQVDFYLNYEEKKDVWCDTNPLSAMQQFGDLHFTFISTTQYKHISDSHVQICYPHKTCHSAICFKCCHQVLPCVIKCYQVYGGKIQTIITPSYADLYYMLPHEIKCTYKPYFATYEQIGFKVLSLDNGTYYTTGKNLTIQIVNSIYLRNFNICVSCGYKFPYMYTNKCYNLKANITLDYSPKYLVYMVHHMQFNVKVYFRWRHLIYEAFCIVKRAPYAPDINLDVIVLTGNCKSGKYEFLCNLLNTSSQEDLDLIINNEVLSSYIKPNSSDIYFMYYPIIECIYYPIFIFKYRIKISVTDLDLGDYSFLNGSIMIKKNLSLVDRNTCVTFSYLTILDITKCFTLRAIIEFSYLPKFQFYCISYGNVSISTSFTHPTITSPAGSLCFFIHGPKYVQVHNNIIFLIQGLISGNYSFQCFLLNSVKYIFITLQVYVGLINLYIEPAVQIILLNSGITIHCRIQPSFLKLSTIRLDIVDRTFNYFENESIVELTNSIVLHKRCFCFVCGAQYNLKAVRCYYFSTTLEFYYIPFRSLYFAWSNMAIEVFLADIYKPNRTYQTLCSYNAFHNFTFELGYIKLNKNIANGSYDLKCTNRFISFDILIRINIYSKMIRFWVYPNETDVYIINQVMDINCFINPDSILNIFPDIRFIKVNTKNFQNVSYRHIRVGGPMSKGNEIICVTCGHEVIPTNATKCFNPYGGPINVTITPLKFKLFIVSNIITCRFTPKFMNYSKVAFIVIGIPKESYTLSTDLTIKIKDDKTLFNRNVCVICGNIYNMNNSRCYQLIGPYKSRVTIYSIIVFVLAVLIALSVYINTYEIM